MKVKIIQGVDENGKAFVCVTLGDETFKDNFYRVSRILTGSDGENYEGILSKTDTIRKGDFRHEFDFGYNLNLYCDHLKDLKSELARRSALVRKWIKSLPYVVEIEFEIDLNN